MRSVDASALATSLLFACTARNDSMKRRIRLYLLAAVSVGLGVLAPSGLQAMYPCDWCVLRYNKCVAEGGSGCDEAYELCLDRCEL
jgi:hypothetical protein